MSTSRPFAYNTGSSIPGTDQVGNLAIGYPTSGFESTGLQWWSGPDEDLGYVIGKPVALNSQPTPVTADALILSTTYKGVDINLSNGNQTAYQQFGYQMSVLGETLISGADLVMFSILSTYADPALPESRFIGVGQTAMNYQGNPYGGYPGNDVKSIGFNSIGDYYYNGNVVQSGLPTWIQGDIVDIAIAHGQYWWIRVNGGDWNNSNTANPTTSSGGLTMNGLTDYYPALCPGYEGTMKVLNNPTYGCPSGYNFLGNVSASVGFSRSSDLTDSSFINIANSIAGPSGPFATASNAKTWLNANGYWTSYVGSTGGTGGTGDFNVFITQVGPDVVWSGSGSFDLTALTAGGTGEISGGFQAGQGIWAIGPYATYQSYSGTFTYPTNFGSGGVGVTSNTGSTFGILPGGSGRLLYVPSGYVSNTNISGTSTYANTTIAGAGLTPGTYTWSWGSAPNTSTLVMVIS